MKREASKFEKGITIIEIVAVIFIISLFSLILINDFPKILKRTALSRVTYKLAQDLRTAQDLGFSGIKIYDSTNTQIFAKGYGIHFDLTEQQTQYYLYADVNGNSRYDGGPAVLCRDLETTPGTDCVLNVVDISNENSSLYIEGFENITGYYSSINFTPPDPRVDIENLITGESQIGIILKIEGTETSRKVRINKTGLIQVE